MLGAVPVAVEEGDDIQVLDQLVEGRFVELVDVVFPAVVREYDNRPAAFADVVGDVLPSESETVLCRGAGAAGTDVQVDQMDIVPVPGVVIAVAGDVDILSLAIPLFDSFFGDLSTAEKDAIMIAVQFVDRIVQSSIATVEAIMIDPAIAGVRAMPIRFLGVVRQIAQADDPSGM